ncbi:MAG: hypothetical protein BRD48_04580 [Bacteroidetes bacterium QS_9_68_14]|nr:MAG: hypothetical protein BRD48_04580 [Bacteroidetes bacterium QS_9_68_14]
MLFQDAFSLLMRRALSPLCGSVTRPPCRAERRSWECRLAIRAKGAPWLVIVSRTACRYCWAPAPLASLLSTSMRTWFSLTVLPERSFTRATW